MSVSSFIHATASAYPDKPLDCDGTKMTPALAQRDPWKLADLKHEMVKASREEVARTSRLAA